MPKISIDNKEKEAISDYIANPLHYIENEEERVYFPGGRCPNETKITRFFFDEDEEVDFRCFMVQSEGQTIQIRLSHLHPLDHNAPTSHACTLVENKLFFHQNADDLPRVMLKAPKLISLEDDNIDENDGLGNLPGFDNVEVIARYNAMIRETNEQKIRNASAVNYFKYTDENRLIKRVVKLAVDLEGRDYVLKSTSTIDEQLVSFEQPISEQPNYFRFFRTSEADGLTSRKIIEFMPYMGDTLLDFLDNNQLSELQADQIAFCMLESYVQQIALKNIVHTDINPTNICIQLIESEIQINYIDFNESFVMGNNILKGRGTAGYYAPEFFTERLNRESQLMIKDTGDRNLIAALDPNYKSIFSPSTDIYALGTCLLEDLHLGTTSPFYGLAMRMRHDDPNHRPNMDEINQELYLSQVTKLSI